MVRHTGLKKRLLLFFAFVLSLLGSYYLLTSPFVFDVIKKSGEVGFIGAFIAGIFYTSGFTAFPAGAALLTLGKAHNPILTSVIAASGSLVGDLLILRFLKNEISISSKSIPKTRFGNKFNRLVKIPLIQTGLVFLAYIIIASPLPDEIGIGLLAFIKRTPSHFALTCFLLDFAGIVALTEFGHLLRT